MLTLIIVGIVVLLIGLALLGTSIALIFTIGTDWWVWLILSVGSVLLLVGIVLLIVGIIMRMKPCLFAAPVSLPSDPTNRYSMNYACYMNANDWSRSTPSTRVGFRDCSKDAEGYVESCPNPRLGSLDALRDIAKNRGIPLNRIDPPPRESADEPLIVVSKPSNWSS